VSTCGRKADISVSEGVLNVGFAAFLPNHEIPSSAPKPNKRLEEATNLNVTTNQN
jgi:hypothetical protein